RITLATANGCREKLDEPLSAARLNLQELRRLMLGFDVDPAQVSRSLSESTNQNSLDSEEIRQAENEILNTFVDICSLFHREPQLDGAVGGEHPSAEAYLFTYLRLIDTRGEGLPSTFVQALQRALVHYGVTTLDRSPELEDSLLWIYKSHQRLEQQIGPIMRVLERRLQRAGNLSERGDESFRTLLERVIFATHEQFPAVSDMAREVHYRYFDQPQFEAAREEVYAEVEADLAYLSSNPDAAGRHQRIRGLVECPHPLVGLFASRFAEASPALREVMLEVFLRRYYRIRMLMDVRSWAADGRCYASTEYDHEGMRVHVFSTHSDYARLAETARTLNPLMAEIPDDHEIVIDLYAWHSEPLSDPETTQQEICALLQQAGFARPIHRILVAVGGPNGLAGTMQQFTYRPSKDGYAEDRFYRGIHPMMGKRLHLWRLTNFNIERLSSAEDVYLIRGVGRDNPKDERLFACAEIRDLTPVRDEKGRIVQLPHLERMFADTLAAIRAVQSQRKANERLHWNRILLYVWPPLNLKSDELNEIVHRLAPSTEGLGLEQVVVRARIPNPETGELRDMVVRISSPVGSGILITFRPANKLQALKPLSEYEQKVVRMRQRGLVYPYEIIKMLTPSPEDTKAEFPPGTFVEHDLGPDNRLVPVERPYGQNKS
ncbi:MAG: carbamoyl-phosphate synthase subunit L, partial [Terriglobales bacterium]